MQQDILALPSRWRLAGCCLLYGAVMLYSSTIVGPNGVNFVSRDPMEALGAFLLTRYVEHGSDQRADWIGNLLMLVPFGFLLCGVLWPHRPALRPLAALGAVSIAILTILVIKYLQLFFPPRTVTLNYILAQSLGAIGGCGLYGLWHRQAGDRRYRGDPVAAFVAGLRLYAGALVLFTLMPLDFALSLDDLRAMTERLPGTMLVLPGEGRPAAVRAVLIVVAGAAFIPIGMLLTFAGHGIGRVRRGLAAVGVLGLAFTTALYGLDTLVLSGSPAAPSILYRSCGIVIGAAALRWLVRQDVGALRARLRRVAGWAVLPYLAGVLLVNRLISLHWLGLHAVLDQANPLGLIPLYDYYIVTKGEAAKNIVGHVVLYLPVGIMLWLRYGQAGARRAFAVAAALSFAVELGRYFRPGLEGDVNAVVVAGLAAMVAARSMPSVWMMIEALGRRSGATPERRLDRRSETLNATLVVRSSGGAEYY